MRRDPERPIAPNTHSAPAPGFLHELAVARKLGLDRDPDIAELLELRAEFPEDEEMRQELAEAVSGAMLLQAADPNAFRATAPYPNDLPTGDIGIGHVIPTGATFALPLMGLTEGVLVSGAPGSGKTTLLLMIALQALHRGLSVLAPDAKRDLRCLLRYAPPGTVHIYTADHLPTAPLAVPVGTNPRRWIGYFSEIFCHAHGLFAAGQAFTTKCVDRLYRDYGVYRGSQTYPSLNDLLDVASDPRSATERVTREHAARVAERLTMVAHLLPAMAARHTGADLSDLVSEPRIVVYELDGLNPLTQGFITEIVLVQTHQHQLRRGRRGVIDLLLLIDEATRTFDATKERTDQSVSTVSVVLQQLRELAVGVCLACQEIRKLTESAIACTGTKIAMGAASGRDVQATGAIMGLTPAQAQFIHRLGRGQAVVRLLRGYHEPFLIQVPHVEFDKGCVSDDDIARVMGPIWYPDLAEDPPQVIALPPASVPGSQAPPGRRSSDPQAARAGRAPAHGQPTIPGLMDTDPKSHPTTSPAESHEQSRQRGLSPGAWRALLDICMHPWCERQERTARLDMGNSAFDRARAELENSGYIVSHTAKTGCAGKAPVLYEPTEKAWAETGLIRPTASKGSWVHKHWAATIAANYRSTGSRAEIEATVAGKSVDVLVRTGAETTAIEIQLSDRHIAENVEKDLAAGIGRVIIAYAERSVADEAAVIIRERFPEHADRVETRALGTFRPRQRD